MSLVTIRDQVFESGPVPDRAGAFWFYGAVNMRVEWHVLQVHLDPVTGPCVAGLPVDRLGGVWGGEVTPPPLPLDQARRPARPARILRPHKRAPARYEDL